MKGSPFSLKFQLFKYIVDGIFWILDFIPVVNIFSNAINWIIKGVIFYKKYRPLIKDVVKAGKSIGSIYLKISIISGIALLLGEIPFVSWVPWNIISMIWIDRLMKQLTDQIKNIDKKIEAVKEGKAMEMKATEEERIAAEEQAERLNEIAQQESIQTPIQYAEEGEEGRITPIREKTPLKSFEKYQDNPQQVGRF